MSFLLGGRLLLAGAAGISLFLAVRSLQGAHAPGCTEGCDAVLTSRWAYVLKLPVSLPGAALYTSVLAFSFRRSPVGPPWLSTLARTLELSILLGALWFAFLQAGVLHAFCPWCTGCHVAASAGVLSLAWARSRSSQPGLPAVPLSAWFPAPAALALAAVVAFALTQHLGPIPKVSRTTQITSAGGTPAVAVTLATNPVPVSTGTAAAPAPRVAPVVSLFNGKFTVKADQYPYLGRAGATNIVVGLFDYTCSHCRHMHGELEHFLADTNHPPFQILELPAVLRPESLEIQRTMLTVWQADPAVYRRISRDLWAERIPAKAEQVRAIANDQLGMMVYSSSLATHGDWINAALMQAQSIRLETEKVAGAKGLPQLIVGSRVIEGLMDGATLRSNLLSAVGLPVR